MNSDEQDEAIKALRKQQDIVHAIIGGAASAILGAAIWAAITVLTQHQIGYVAVALGFLSGISVRFFGLGIDRVFGWIGAISALIGCVLGNLLSQVVFISQAESISYMEVLSLLNIDLIISIYKDSFSPLDILFYAIAGYEGHKFAFRPLTDELLAQAKANELPPIPYEKLRVPVAVSLLAVLLIGTYFLLDNNKFEKTYNYESGAIMSKGILSGGKEEGLWKYWWENGKDKAIGMYVNGKPDSTWQYYNEEGKMTRMGSFKDGFEDGQWTDFYPDGKISSVSYYKFGRLSGPYTLYYNDGTISQQGNYQIDLLEGKSESFYENKNLSSSGFYQNSKPVGPWKFWNEKGEMVGEYIYEDDIVKIVNAWDSLRHQMIKDGNGIFKTFYPDGKAMETGKIKDGYKSGLWKTYFNDGTIKEEGEFRDNVYHIINTWTPDSKLIISKGEGQYSHSNASGFEKGTIHKGLRSGEWILKKMESDSVPSQIATYKDGKLNGKQKFFFDSGEINAEGDFKDNKRDGTWIWYYKNGSIESSILFGDGKKEGIQIFYNEGEEKIKEEVYKNNKLLETKIF